MYGVSSVPQVYEGGPEVGSGPKSASLQSAHNVYSIPFCNMKESMETVSPGWDLEEKAAENSLI